MNTLEILYQAFRVRYSLNQLQQILDRGCRIALLGPDDAPEILRSYFGDPIPSIGGEDPAEDLVVLPWPLDDSALKELNTCDACLVLFPQGDPEVDTLHELAGKIPIHIKTMWMCIVDQQKGGSFHEDDLTLPTVQALPKARAQERFLRLLMVSLPQVVVILARNWSQVRTTFCKILTRRTALRNGVRSGVSALPLRSVPVVGPVLALLATSAETMLLTSSQLRLSFVIAAAHNRPLDFFDRISELWPIVGSAFGFRGVSRTLVKMMPALGPGLKAAISFSGTYAIGEACRLYYEHGQPSSDEMRREILRRSQEEGAKEAQRLFRKVMAGQSLEEIEEEEGVELLEAVDQMTQPPTIDSGDEQLEPTVEMEAVVAEEAIKTDTLSPQEEPSALPEGEAAETRPASAAKEKGPEATDAPGEKKSKKKRSSKSSPRDSKSDSPPRRGSGKKRSKGKPQDNN